jgi:tripartite-type tricarboxylate transporter receptor subunit TctC
LLLPAPASAGEYYAGKSIDLLIGAPPGGGYDIYARALVVAKLYASPRDVVMRARQIIAP